MNTLRLVLTVLSMLLLAVTLYFYSQSYHDLQMVGFALGFTFISTLFSIMERKKVVILQQLCSFPLEGLSYIFNFNFALSLSIEQFILSVQIFEKALRKPLHCVIIKKIHLR